MEDFAHFKGFDTLFPYFTFVLAVLTSFKLTERHLAQEALEEVNYQYHTTLAFLLIFLVFQEVAYDC